MPLLWNLLHNSITHHADKMVDKCHVGDSVVIVPRAEYTAIIYPDSKVNGANMGPIWGQQDPGGPHVGPWPHEPCYLGLCDTAQTYYDPRLW